jgi:hypothetical protein
MAAATGAARRRNQAEVSAVSDDLTGLQAEFPAFRIWRERFPGRSRYVARSRHLGLNPHTVVTTNLRELREVLQPGPSPAAAVPIPQAGSRVPMTPLPEPERDATSTRAAESGCSHAQ